MLVFLLAVTSVFGLTGLKSVKAEETVASGFNIVGASLRANGVGEVDLTGIRFETVISSEVYNTLTKNNAGKVIKFGTIISDVNGLEPIEISYATSENGALVQTSDGYKFYASITFNDKEFALDVLNLKYPETNWTLQDVEDENYSEAQAGVIAKYKAASYAELLKATSYYQIGDDAGTREYTTSLTRSMRMVANWYVDGDKLNEEQKEFIKGKNYFTAVEPIEGFTYIEVGDGEIVNDNGEAYVIPETVQQVAYQSQNVPVVDGKLDFTNVDIKEALGENITIYFFDADNNVSALTAKYVTEYITTVAEMKKAVEIGDLTVETTVEGYTQGDLYNDGYYVLGCDLDFDGYKIEHYIADTVTTTTAPYPKYNKDRPFVGTFDGQGYALKNVEVLQGSGIFGQVSHKANIKNLAIIDYSFPYINQQAASPMSVLGVSDSLGSTSDVGGAVIEDLYITIKNLNWVSVNQRKAMLFGTSSNKLTKYKNIVIEVDIPASATGYETSRSAQPVLFWAANYTTYAQSTQSKYYYKANSGSTSLGDGANADVFDNVIIISKDNTNTDKTFRLIADSSGNQLAVAYNDKDTAKAISGKTNNITNDGTSFYYPEYYYTDAEGNATFIKPENYEGVNNIVIRRYDDYTAFAGDTNTDKTSLNKFNSDMWVVSNGAVYYKGIYKDMVKCVVSKDDVPADEILYSNVNDEYSFNFNDGKDIDATNIVIELEENEYLEVDGNKVVVKENVVIPIEAVQVGITVSQTIGAITASASYTATIQKPAQEITKQTYLDLSTGLLDTNAFTGNATALTIKYDGNTYPVELSDGKATDVSVLVVLTSASETETLRVKIGESVFDITATSGVFPTFEAVAVVGDNVYNFTNFKIASKVIKTKEDLAYLTLTANNTTRADYVVLGDNINATGYTHTQPATTTRLQAFNGIFDGQGYTISNLDLTNVAGGLFGSLDYKATIRNLGLYDVKAVSSSILAYNAHLTSTAVIIGDSALTVGGTNKPVPCIKFDNIYVKLAKGSKDVQGLVSNFGNNHFFWMSNIVVDWQDAPTVTVENGKVYEDGVEVTDTIGIFQASTTDLAYGFSANNFKGFASNYFITSYPLMYRSTALTASSKHVYNGPNYSNKLANTTVIGKVWGMARNSTAPNGVTQAVSGSGADVNAFSYIVDIRSEEYATTADLISANKDLSSFNSYWDTTSGAPVWISAREAANELSVKLNIVKEEQSVEDVVINSNTDTYTFKYTGIETITGTPSITVEENEYIEVVDGVLKVKAGAVLPSLAQEIEVTVSQTIYGKLFTSKVIATVQQIVIDIADYTYFDIASGALDTDAFTGNATELVIEYNDNSYTTTLNEGKTTDVSLVVVNASTLRIKIGSYENIELALTDGAFPTFEATAVVDGTVYNFEKVQLVSKVLKEKEDLAYLTLTANNTTRADYVVLAKNIDATGYTHTQPASTTRLQAFNGIFDGQGYTISNLDLTNVAGGLFGAFDHYATIKNVGLYDVKVVSSPILSYYANITSHKYAVGDTGLTTSDSKLYPTMTIDNIYVKIAKGSKDVKGLVSGFGSASTHSLSKIVVDWQDAPAVTIEDGKVYEDGVEVTGAIGVLQASTSDKAHAFNANNVKGFANNYFITSYPLMYRSTALTPADAHIYNGPNYSSDRLNTSTTIGQVWGVARNLYNPNNVAQTVKGANASVNVFSYIVDVKSEQYATKQDLINAGKTLTAFNSYWDTTSGAPVWRTIPTA